MQERVPRWAVALFFAAFVLLGLFTAADYGPSWDEQDEMDILRMNLWEYSRFFGLDESAFEARAAQEDVLTISTLTPISQSIEQDHGMALFYPMAGAVMSDAISEETRSALWHMWCWCVFTLGAFALYGVCRQLGLSRGMALLGPVFLLLSPRFFAQGHYNNKDIALMALALCLLWQALRLMKKPEFFTGVLFSFFGALAANTKVAGAALWGLCALFVLLSNIRRMNGRIWAVAGVTFAAFFGFYALVTPALWASPMAFAKYLVDNALSFQRWKNLILFRGTVFNLRKESLPFYYLPYMMVVTTPLWLVLLGAAGTALAVFRRKMRLDLWLAVLMWTLPLGFAVLTGTTVYNGWRHFYFVYGSLLALAVWAVSRMPRKKLLSALLAACMIWTAAETALNHPHQQTYYQPVVRLRGENFNELDYWNVSAREALQKLADQEEGELRIAAADLWAEDALKKALLTMPSQEADRFVISEDAQYVLANPTYLSFSGFDVSDMEEAVSLNAYGQSIMCIYEKEVQE